MTSQENITFDLRTARGSAPRSLARSVGAPPVSPRAFRKDSETLMSTPVHSSDAKELRGGAYRFPPPRPASGDVILASDRLGEDAPAMDEPSRRRTQRSRQPCQTEVGRRFRFTVTGATRHRRRRCTQ